MKDNVFSKMMGHTVIDVNYAVHIGGKFFNSMFLLSLYEKMV